MDVSQLAIVAAVAVVNLGLALAVFLRNRKSTSHRAFAAAVGLIVAWLVVAYLSDQPMFASSALLLNRLTLAVAMLMGALLLRFALVFPAKKASLPSVWVSYLWVGALLAVITVLTPLVVADVYFRPSGTDVVSGVGFGSLIAWVCLGTAACVIALARKYRRAAGLERAQLKFMALGVAGFALFSVVFGLLLPAVTGSYALAHLNALSTLFMVSLTTYAMVRHRLMDIQLVVLRGTAFVLLLSVLGAGLVGLASLTRQGMATSLNIGTEAVFVVASLLAVLAFQPLYRVLEHATDRIFFQRTYSSADLLRQLGLSMTSTLDLRELAETVAGELAGTMRLTFAAVAYHSAGVPQLVDDQARHNSDRAAVLLELCHDDHLLVTDELEPDSSRYRRLTELGIRVLAPLVAEGELLGAIVLGPKESGGNFSSRDLEVVEVLVPEAAIAMKNAHLFDERNQRVRELTALNKLAFALGSSVELEDVLDAALEEVVAVTGADSGSIMLVDKETETLTVAASVGVEAEIVASTRIPIGRGVAGWVAQHRKPLTLPRDADLHLATELLRDEIASSICAPVLSKDVVIGVLSVNRRSTSEHFVEENLHMVTSFAGQLGIAVENARLYADLESTFLGTISALAAAVDAKDPYTFGHSNEVTTHAVAIAEKLGLDEDRVHMIRIAATLHDIGKIGIDGTILLKPGGLTPEERELVNQHPAIGADILAPLDFLRDTVPLVLFHHERYGGGGYPTGISGDAIPFGARIIAVADSFNAMVSDRPYRKGLSLETAMKELRDGSGTQFDPAVTQAFLELLADASRTQSPMTTALRW